MSLSTNASDLFQFWQPFIIDRAGGTPHAAGSLYATSFDTAPLTDFFGPTLTGSCDGWRLLTGLSSQAGPVFPPYQTIDATLIKHFQAHPGMYVTIPLDDRDGWVIAYCPASDC